MSEKILCVDDDPNILAGYQRTLRKQFTIETALGPEAAVQMLKAQGPYAVIISDMNMPGMNGIQFLAKAKEMAPDSVRMMLTGNADLRTAIDAVHRGNVFRFLVKPFPAESLAIAIDAGIEQYRLVNAEHELLEKTLRGSIRVLIEILSMLDPHLFGRSQALKQHMRSLAESMRLPNVWQLELAAMLAQIGIVTLPPTVLHKTQSGRAMSEAEENLLKRVPEISCNLLSNIPRLEEIAEIIRYQDKNFDGTGFPKDAVSGNAIPIGARMLKILTDMVKNEAGGMSRRAVLSAMTRHPGRYDQRIIEAAITCFAPADANLFSNVPRLPVTLSQLKTGHVLACDIETSDGTLLISGGHKISETLLEKIKNFVELSGIREPIYVVHVQGEESKAA